ncbi:glutamate racemase [bacterium]|nr:glutamate racemase [bacterium]
MNNNSPIGFFDSGVGGLSVYARFKKLLPNENTIYYGDLKNLPYGNKTQAELIGFTKNIMDFFVTKDVKAVVIACNTSSALAYETIKDDYDFKIYPIIQASAKLISKMDIKRLGVFATVGTVNSGAYKREILKHNSDILIKEIACPNWVSVVEGKISNGTDEIKKHVEEMFEFAPDKVILGCTHYPYLINDLIKFAPKDMFIDPAKYFVKFIKDDLIKSDLTTVGTEKFYVSANPELFMNNAKMFYNVEMVEEV